MTKQECKSSDFDLVDREVATTTVSSTTATTVVTNKPDDMYCGSNLQASNTMLCGSMKWHCNTQTEINNPACSDWSTRSCCGGRNADSCDRNALMADGDAIFNEWFKEKNSCGSPASQLFNSPQKCVTKDSMTNQQICGKLRWYCDDPQAQDLLDMTS